MKKAAAAITAALAVIGMAGLSGAAFAGDHPKQAQQQEQEQKSESGPSQSAQNPEPKVYVCHATGSASNPYVLIQVSSHALPAHTRHQDGRDIVLGDKAGPCPAGGVKAAEDESKGKVYICHSTGSATNPYVLIRVSVNALPAHTRHHDGRDIVLGDTAGPCPAAVTTTTTATAATTTTTESTTTTSVATTTTTAAAAALQSPPSNTAAAGGVLGASKALSAPASTPAKAPAGVLGTLKTLGKSGTSGTLPFTGLRLWIFELIALGLIGAGVAMRLAARRSS